MKKDARFKWNQEQKSRFVIDIEQRRVAVRSRAVLAHVMADDREAPIALGPRTPQAAENHIHNWSIIFVIKNQADFKWKTIIILTDHKSFLGIFNSIKTISNYMSPKMLRWTLVLGAYQYDIKYREGKRYRHADALSRLPLKMLVPLFQKFPIYTVEKIKPNS